MKIAFFDSKKYDRQSFNGLMKGLEIDFFSEELNYRTVNLCRSEHDAVCCFVHDSIDQEVIKSLQNRGIGLITLRCAGYNNVDLNAAEEAGIKVTRVPAYSPESVAEFTMALFFCLLRKIHRSYLRTRELNFSLEGLVGGTLKGKTVGIIGTGKIGECLVRQLQGFNCQVLANDIHPKESLKNLKNFNYCSLDDLVRGSDILSLHVPLTKETHHLLNNQKIEMMKDSCLIVNTGRGGLIDTAALIAGLKKRKIQGAALDVYEEEEDYFFKDCSDAIITDDILARLITFPNVIVTSHQGFLTQESLDAIAKDVCKSFFEFHRGEPLTHEIRLENV